MQELHMNLNLILALTLHHLSTFFQLFVMFAYSAAIN